MTKVKICGVRNVSIAQACRDFGVDFVGFNFVSSSRRSISLEKALSLKELIIKGAHERVPEIVGVFSNSEPYVIDKAARFLGLRWIQLHGNEPPKLCEELSRRYRVIKAISIKDTYPRELVESYETCAELLLFDGISAGSGKAFAWSTLEDQPVKKPYLLAGGLNPDNIAGAIARLNPYGVDTASGVETDGEQDVERLSAFLESVMGARS